jgi:hypothetical protein
MLGEGGAAKQGGKQHNVGSNTSTGRVAVGYGLGSNRPTVTGRVEIRTGSNTDWVAKRIG